MKLPRIISFKSYRYVTATRLQSKFLKLHKFRKKHRIVRKRRDYFVSINNYNEKEWLI